MSELDCIRESYQAFKPLLDALPLATKIEIYNAIYNQSLDPANLSDELLSIGCAISVDPDFQKWELLRM